MAPAGTEGKESDMPLFAVGTVGFWILLSVVCLLLFVTVEFEKAGLATLSVIATLALLGWLGDFNLWLAIKTNPLWALVFIAAYVLLGLGWSFGKWYVYVTNKRDKFRDAKEEEKKVTSELQQKRVELDGARRALGLAESAGDDARLVSGTVRHLEYRVSELHKQANGLCHDMNCNHKPLAKENKNRILTWMIYWPWSLVWTVIDDPIKKFFKYLFRKLRAAYQGIADRAYKGLEDKPSAAPPPFGAPHFEPLDEPGEPIPPPPHKEKATWADG